MDCGENSIKDLECALLFVDYYKLKGEYDDAEKRKDLDPNAYSDLHQRLDKAGVKVGKRVAAASYESKTPEVVPKVSICPQGLVVWGFCPVGKVWPWGDLYHIGLHIMGGSGGGGVGGES